MSSRRLAFSAIAGMCCLGVAAPAALVVFRPGAIIPDIRPWFASATPSRAPLPPTAARSPSAPMTTASIPSANPAGDATPALAYANPDPGVTEPFAALRPSESMPAIIMGPTGLREAVSAYRAGDLAAGDAAAATADDPIARIAIEWAALRLQPQAAGLPRIKRFLAEHADWPADGVLRRRAEEMLWADKKPPEAVTRFFEKRRPETALGKLALARARLAAGAVDEAAVIAREVWRDGDIPAAVETALLRDFGDYLTWDDHKHRSDRLWYRDGGAASMRAAGLAGPEVLALAKARENGSEKAVAALPAELRSDPTLLFARVQKARKDNRPQDAARLLLTAPRDPEVLVNADEWWVERRLVARKLIDSGQPKLAYRIAADHSAGARDQRIDAEFHAGWIALRFLADPARADTHFARAAGYAETPISVARIAYWRGRVAEALENSAAAEKFNEAAARHPTTFYGQLALARLGRSALPVRQPASVARADERSEAVRVVEMLETIDARDLAATLAIEMARHSTDEAQLAALGEAIVGVRDARLALNIGKLAGQRGYVLDELAFPVFGIPAYEPVAGSAPAPVVYAIARQESAFDPRALSSAGAKGLMQMMPATARNTAAHKGIAFDESRLLNDPSFNAMLGAAHLGELNVEHRGSLILSFAAYNAGGRRVKEWIAAHGDPRDPAVDPVDWIELIPIAETRNYVQRVAENLEVYRARLTDGAPLSIEATLREPEARN